ncbi:DUF2784 domain-containing protein [Stutzerimonas balearica]|uniref:DUF2784 domain-containing protein n=1 Tax=Stutzerimonas balearica TaxID=74829 RepID=UPI0028AC1C76|nr:DUF2784 domain-containing protein [Stutzerimonas balearica]
MLYRLAADSLLVLHLGFVLFALLGGLLVAWKPRLLAVQLPAAAWAIFVEITDHGCPLTHWEQRLRSISGDTGYSEGFIEHYLLPALYPSWLSLPVQYVLAGVVLLANLLIYAWLWRRRVAQSRHLRR